MIDALLHAIKSADLGIYHFLNGYAGQRLLNRLVAFEEENNLVKGGLFLAAYACLWFHRSPDQENHRRETIAIFAGTMLAIVLSRIVADILPFRIRPMYEPAIAHHPYALSIAGNMERWSSFPSDTAAYFTAIAFGLGHLVRRYAAPLALYTAVWICLPRLFLGEHYLSDVVMGSVIGISAVWASLRSEQLRDRFSTLLLSFLDAKPGVFYSVAFLVCFEMSVMFADLRSAAHLIFNVSFHLLPIAAALFGLAIGVAYAVARVSRSLVESRARLSQPPSTVILTRTATPHPDPGRPLSPHAAYRRTGQSPGPYPLTRRAR